MARIWFSPGKLADHFHEIIGYKAGLASSIEQMCDLLSGTGYSDDILSSEHYGLALRSEDYEYLYYHLLYKVGVTDTPRPRLFTQSVLFKRIIKEKGIEYLNNIQNIYSRYYNIGVEQAVKNGQSSVDPKPMLAEVMKKYGATGARDLIDLMRFYDAHFQNSPHTSGRWQEWKDIVNLNDLFENHQPVVSHGTFLDQRFINYLSNNIAQLGEIHWRKFEELIGECFSRSGYKVELGPGTNDDGVDIRVWNDSTQVHPEFIIQCKRYKSKIDKVTVKGLYADVLEEQATTGLLVTTSEFSPGARTTISARSYPIKEVNGEKVSEWLHALRTPGSGVIRV
ncbi:restriction endonuclease [Plesiomonas shigelloides]|uniref:restriction endonuclease n=1 Tax=Plesiomonas shigelloides TaxID=703 RepID=UPI001786E276|nr:restriction endonuclease [Plesiomonas shigelloides]QOH78582.1 restriction endonuclease [Plesiomonas shigelloides]